MGGGVDGSAVDGGVVPGEEVRLNAPLQGTVVLLPIPVGGTVSAGAIVVVLESMKMEHVVRSPVAGTLAYLDVEVGGLVADGTPLAVVEAGEPEPVRPRRPHDVDLDAVRPDLAELFARRLLLSDAGRPEVVARRHERGRRTARRTSTTCATRGASRSTAASPSPPSATGVTRPSSSSAHRPTGSSGARPG